MAGTQVRARAVRAGPRGRGAKSRARAASSAVGQRAGGSAWRITSEVEPRAEAAFYVEAEPWHDVKRRRELDEDLEERRVREHQVEADGHARREREAVAATSSEPEHPAAGADVPVELGLPANEVRLPEVVEVDRPVAVAAEAAAVGAPRGVVPAAIVEAVAPEAEAEVDRVRGADPVLPGDARRIAEHEAQPEATSIADLGRLSRADGPEEENRCHKGGDECPFHGAYSRTFSGGRHHLLAVD
jgi:hypothetical protein